MKKESAKKYGLAMCLCMVMGTVIGSGIFFKNEGVYGFVNGNGILGIIAWIVGGIAAISFGLSFMEIASAKQDSNSGIALYARIFGGYKLQNVVRNAMNNIYIPLTLFTVAYYVSEASIWLFGGGKDAEIALTKSLGGPQYYQLLVTSIAIVYTTWLILCVTYKETWSKWIQMSTVILKLIPLFLIGLIGLIVINPDAGAFKDSGLGDPNKWDIVKGKNNFSMLLMAMPGILFAFDGFLSTTYIQKDVRDAHKNVPLALVFGLTFVTIIYVWVSIGTLNLDPSGSVAKAASRIFSNHTANLVFERVIYLFILISAFGTLNGYSIAMVKLTGSSIEDEFIIGHKLVNKITAKYSEKFSHFIVSLIISIGWGLIMGIPTIIITKINFYDFISNAGVVMAFLMYGLIISCGLYNRYSKKIKTIKSWYFIPAAIISLICISTILGYNIYSYFEAAVNATPEQRAGIILQIISLVVIVGLPWLGIIMKDKEKRLENQKDTTKNMKPIENQNT